MIRMIRRPFISLIAGVTALVAASAHAEYVGLVVVERSFDGVPGWTDALVTYDVFARFDEPTDRLLSVGGLVEPAALATTDPLGFQNHPLGTDTPPPALLIPLQPALQWDSFVTIGIATSVAPGQILITPGMPPITGNFVAIPNGEGWAEAVPGLGIAGSYPNYEVLITRLTFRRPASFGLQVSVQYLGDGDLQTMVDFAEMILPQLDCNSNGDWDLLDLDAGTSDDCNENAVPDECDIAAGDALDCNANGVPDTCDIASGTSLDVNGNGIPDECDDIDPCPADLDGSFTVDFSDLLTVLASWGVCPDCPADIDDDGIVGFTDVLFVLASWGPCR